MRFNMINTELFRKMIRRIIGSILRPNQYAKWIGVKVGKGCLINTKHFPTEAYLITLGDYVRVAPETHFFTHGGLWPQRFRHPELYLEQFGKIQVGDYSYIGEGCLIMPGVCIGKDCVVGAGSVVTKSVPDGMMVAGNPARIIGKTEDMVQRVAARCPVKSKDFYRLKGKDRDNFIKSIPDEFLVHKKTLDPK